MISRRLQRTLSLLASAAVLSLLIPAVSFADVTTSKSWPQIEKIDQQLLDGKWKSAARSAKKLAEYIEHKTWFDPDLRQVMTDLAFFRSVAAANLGEQATAIHYWHIALNIDAQRARQRDLTGYGDAAKILLEFPLRRLGETAPGFQIIKPPYRRGFEPPVIPEPERNIIENTGAWQERPPDFHAEILLDEKGRISHPIVQSETHPILVYATLEYLLFEQPPGRPAHMDGEPVAVLYPITMRYLQMGF